MRTRTNARGAGHTPPTCQLETCRPPRVVQHFGLYCNPPLLVRWAWTAFVLAVSRKMIPPSDFFWRDWDPAPPGADNGTGRRTDILAPLPAAMQRGSG